MQVELLLESSEFVARLLDDIAAAKRRVWVQCLSFEGDDAGSSLSQALLDNTTARDRRLLIDDFTRYVINDQFLYSPRSMRNAALQRERSQTATILGQLHDASVSVRWTNPIRGLVHRLSARNHKKIIVIDDAVYVGGFNFSDHNFAWHDLMIRIDEPAWVDALARDFDVSWNEEPPQQGYQELPQGGLLMFPGRGRSREARRMLLRTLASAQRSIFIESPYLSEPLFSILRERADAGLRVDLVLPDKNNWRSYDDYTRACLASSRVHVHFFPGMTHLKAALIDENALWMGSANFEYFGLHCHQELLAKITEPTLVANFIRRVRDVDINASRTVDTASFESSAVARWRVESTFRVLHGLNRIL